MLRPDRERAPRGAAALVLLAPCVLLAAAVAASPSAAQAPNETSGSDAKLGTVEVSLDLPQDKPYVGEMILLRMRSFIRADIARDEIIQPPLLNFSWQQLGRDKPIEAMVGGFRVAGIERDLAIFPDTSGRLIIEPFDRHVTIITPDGQRKDEDFLSKPIYVDVQNHAGIGAPDQWWLPSKAVTITDSWSQPSDEMKPGTLATRTVTVEAVGLTGDRLPPPPDVQAPGTITFRGPVARTTLLTEDGPVARGVYQWSLRPATDAPARISSIAIPWFDTQSRRMRIAATPPVWLAYVGTLVHPSHEKPMRLGLLSPGPLAAGAAGFAWMALLVAVAASGGAPPLGRDARRRARALASVRRAARAEDDAAFADALVGLGRADPARWRRISGAPTVAPGLAALDAARFGRPPSGAPARAAAVALRPLAGEIDRLWHVGATLPTPDDMAGLPPLDAPMPALRRSPRAWFYRLRRRT